MATYFCALDAPVQGAADGVLIFVLRLTLRWHPFILGPATLRRHGHRGRAVDFHNFVPLLFCGLTLGLGFPFENSNHFIISR